MKGLKGGDEAGYRSGHSDWQLQPGDNITQREQIGLLVIPVSRDVVVLVTDNLNDVVFGNHQFP